MTPAPLRALLDRIPGAAALHAAWRGRSQEQLFQRSAAWYEKRAGQLGLQLVDGVELEGALRRRLSGRPHPVWPRPRGQLHVFLAYGGADWEEVLPLSLAPFGRVSVFDWQAHGFEESGPQWIGRREEMNRAMLQAFAAAWQEQPVDAVVGYLSGHNTAPATVAHMAGRGSAVFNFCFDDKLHLPGRKLGGRDVGPATIAGEVDLNLTNAPSSRIKYALHGGLSLFWPEAAHPDIHRPYDTPFDIDVSFVGAKYGWREPFIKRLARLLQPADIKVRCFGRGWPEGMLTASEMVRLYSRSRINLGFSGVGYSRRVVCLKGRDFEVPMSGGLYLAQHNPELSLVFEVGSELLTYRDEADCARIVRELLAQPGRAQAIRVAGRERCLRDHTYERRWAQVFQLAGIIVPS